ncbi:hypothetical protein HMPREF1544_08882 [Mucor circinelloides 1006PhL]|uniref:Reverse transcriptase zinc-binding domain-containing protein n=1 Tax=Mucor circinelloides f. circinelloides (strain 1006PhL) TaxID=1220926 RepID=S2JP35_MUCC1|nr:hypothetical protein HMPREF1544_08882 [Mucor circinelloides 1006PhL]
MAAPSTNGFKSLPKSSPPKIPPKILSPSRWKIFWSLRIPLNARNTWYRVLHDKIATGELLQSRLKTPPDPTCTLCKSAMETTEHFLFTCPVKRSFWTTAFLTYMPPNIHQSTYPNFRKFLFLEHPSSRQHHPLYPELTVHQVFACMLQTIWYYRYQHLFNQTPFLSTILLAYLRTSLSTLHSQENIDQFLF